MAQRASLRAGDGLIVAGMRRAIDVLLALIGLALLSLPMLLAMLAIRLDDGSPSLFKQARYGRGGRVFTVCKLRTMHVQASDRPAATDDERITRVGRILRAIGLDEAPQLVNILLGHMSFVGPRALSVNELVDGRRYQELPGFDDRHRVRPGLTGPAAFFLPKDVNWDTKFAADISYAQHRRLGEDVRLIGVSVVVSLLGRWEHRSTKLAVTPPPWMRDIIRDAA